MGTSITVKCRHCKRWQKFFLGTGMLNFCEEQLFDLTSPINLLSYCSANEMDKVKRLVESGKVHLAKDFGYKVYRCNQCETYGNDFVFKLTNNDEIIYQNDVYCRTCDSQDLNFNISQKEIICSSCGKNMEIVELSNWD